MKVGHKRELVVSRGRGRHGGKVLMKVWRVAEDEAREAYLAWREHGGREAYLRYRAAADRADAALDGLLGAQ
jgi:hypothetical protein